MHELSVAGVPQPRPPWVSRGGDPTAFAADGAVEAASLGATAWSDAFVGWLCLHWDAPWSRRLQRWMRLTTVLLNAWGTHSQAIFFRFGRIPGGVLELLRRRQFLAIRP